MASFRQCYHNCYHKPADTASGRASLAAFLKRFLNRYHFRVEIVERLPYGGTIGEKLPPPDWECAGKWSLIPIWENWDDGINGGALNRDDTIFQGMIT